MTRRIALAVALLGVSLFGDSPAASANASVAAQGFVFHGDLPDPFVQPTAYGYFAYGSTSSQGGPLLPVLYSADLRDWQAIGPALTQAPPWTDGGQLWAPSVVRAAGEWRLLFSARSLTTGSHCLGLARSTTPFGPFVDRGTPWRCSPHGSDMIDPEAFVDADGSAWLLWKSASDDLTPTIWSQRFDPVGGEFDGVPNALVAADQPWEQPVIEAPSMVRWDNGYGLFYSGGTFIDERYAVGYARCSSPAGPCTKLTAPVLRSHGNVIGPGGQAVFFDLEGRLRLAFHSWTPSPVGAIRALRTASVLGTAARPIVAGRTLGALDTVSAPQRGIVTVEGWAFDTMARAAATVILDVDGRPTAPTELRRVRLDVDAALGVGGARSFVGTVTLGPGRHSICARPPESHTPIGCRVVTIRESVGR